MEIVGVGNALMDVIAFVDEDFAPSLGFHNNGIIHMERGRLGDIAASLSETFMTAGGGAANTARTASVLGMKSAFAGRIGDDELGRRYREELESSGLEALLSVSGAATGIFCALVRPDGGRTLLVSPGAALDLVLDPPPEGIFRKGGLLYLEGYLLRDRAYFMALLAGGKAAGMEIALDLGSRSLVLSQRDFLIEALPDYCDLLFANEDEFSALAGLPLREGLDLFSPYDICIVVKRAERGAVWASAGEVIDSPVRELCPFDETGAGDAFSAGFLVARDRGMPPERCLRTGNRVAEEVIRVPGIMVEPERLKRAAAEVGCL